MAEQAGDAGCLVVVLAPRQGSGATLCCVPAAVGGGAVCTLPTVVVSAEPGMDEVVRAVSRLLGAPVTLLRANAAAWDAGFDTTAMLVAGRICGRSGPGRDGWLRQPSGCAGI
jgi:hypothetical protein